MKRLNFYLLLLLFSLGCERYYNIDDHFTISTFNEDDLSLFYLDDQNRMFDVIGPTVKAYFKCGNDLYIVQKPSSSTRSITDLSTEYYILDLDVDYSNERLKPFSVSKSRFEETLKTECPEGELNEL